MWARKLPYILASLLPVLLLVVLAINGRFFVSPWVTPEYGRDGSQTIVAYVPMVRYSELHYSEIAHLSENHVTEIRDKWLDLDRNGKLKEIALVAADDDGGYGPRYEIENARRLLLASLIRLSDRKNREGKFSESAQYLIDAMNVANIAKYSSGMSVATSATVQSDAIARFENLRSHVSGNQTRQFNEAVTMMRVDPNRVQHLAARLGALAQNATSSTEISLPNAKEMKILVSNEVAIAHQEFNDPGSSLLVHSLRIAYKLEFDLASIKDRYRAIVLKSQPESTRRLLASSG